MSKSKLSDSVVDKLSFHGNKNLFAAYKEKLKAHLKAMGDALVETELQAKRRRPVARYEDALVQEPVLEEPGPGASVEDQEYYALQVAYANNQQSHIKNLFNLTLPSGFADDKLMQKPFDEIIASDFKSISHLFRQLKAARDQVNRNSAEALKFGLISQQMMLIKVMSILPGHLWGSAIVFTPEEFTLEKIESKLCAIFGNKSKAQIKGLTNMASVNHVNAKALKASKPRGSALGKRKAPSQPDVPKNASPGMSFFYCAGVHNDISGGPHLKNKREKRKRDIESKVFRRNIWSYSSALKKARNDTEPTPKMTGKGKIKAQAKGKERTVVSTNDCLPKDVSVDACNAVQSTATASSTPSISPPDGIQFPPTPGQDLEFFNAEETDDPMGSVFDFGVNGARVNESEAGDVPMSPGEQSIAGDISLRKIRLEDKAVDSA
ncbi:hypothetical protein PF004_g15869 [Phytophthora fragariae]|uniref:Uncharacterized protein n=1 Tax=Phytophthora fragariae TaxID=53985 RepID=A0A6G0NK32_9STRA|nr:hypothetical protein PF004_g15869 [Phytophthora fragariae]